MSNEKEVNEIANHYLATTIETAMGDELKKQGISWDTYLEMPESKQQISKIVDNVLALKLPDENNQE